jgi:hypothetical protein
MIVLLDPEDVIQNRKEGNVEARNFYKLDLKSCNFVLKIRLYWFLIYKLILHFYRFHVSTNF